MSENTGQRREEEIFEQALEFSTEAERIGFLKGACGGDQELYARLVDLLHAHSGEDNFIKTVSGDEGVTFIDSPISEGPGTVIGRYKLLQQIGEGGMGVVYMAQQEEPVKRKVALKIIKLGMDTKHVVARFEAERQALAMMDHPNIARVLDGGATETGRPFFVMELVQGVPITEFCDKNKLTAKERLDLFIPVCSAIHSAHQKGIIHRDIKPSNVLVTLHHGDPMPKVIDFGIAKATNQKLTEKTLFTNYAQMIGTPAYMSPEQAEMSSMDVDTRTDVYSLGVLLYELLTGTTPFSSKRLSSMAYGEMQRVIAEEEPEKPSTRMSTMEVDKKTTVAKQRNVDVASLSKQFKGDIDWIVMKCLEKDRRRRYDSPQELVNDLRHFLNNEPVSAAAPSFAYQVQKMARRYRTAFRAAAAIAVVLVLGSTIATWQAVKATRAQRVANDALEKQKELSDSLEASIADALEQKETANRRFYRSSIDQAEVMLVRKEPGFRAKAETLLAEAAALETDVKDPLEMRNAAMALMLQPYSEEGEVLNQGLDIFGVGEVGRGNPARDEFAQAFEDGSIRVIDPLIGEVTAVLKSESAPVQSIAYSDDGNTLMSAHQGGDIRIWHREASGAWTLQRELSISVGDAVIVLICVDEGFAALVSGSDQLRYWQSFTQPEPEFQTLPAEFQFLIGYGFPVSLSPIEPWLAIWMSETQSLEIWDLEEKHRVQHFEIGIPIPGGARAVGFSPDGNYLLFGASGFFRMYRTDTFEVISQKTDFTNWFPVFSFSSDNTLLVYGDGPTYLHLLIANQPMVTLVTEPGRFSFSRTANELVQIQRQNDELTIKRWAGPSHEFIELIGHGGAVKGITFHPTEPWIITTSRDNTIRFWDLEDGREIQRMQTPQGASEDIVFSPDKRVFVTALEVAPGVVQIRDARTTEVITEFEMGTRSFFVDFSPDGSRLSVAADGVLKVFSYELITRPGESSKISLNLLKEFREADMGFVTNARFSRDGRYLLWFETGLNNGQGDGRLSNGIRIWDIQNDRILPHRIMASRAWNSFDFSGVENQIAVGGLDGEFEIWNYVAGKLVEKLEGWNGGIEHLDISEDGRLLAFSNLNNKYGVYDLKNREMLFMSPDLNSGVFGLRWSDDGNHLGVVESNGQARVLDMTAIRGQLAELGIDWE